MKLYHAAPSTCSQKVRLVLAEKGLDYESVELDLQAGDQFEPGYLDKNPNGVVPTLEDGSATLIESTRLAMAIASLREVPTPAFNDLMDAIVATMCAGDSRLPFREDGDGIACQRRRMINSSQRVTETREPEASWWPNSFSSILASAMACFILPI